MSHLMISLYFHVLDAWYTTLIVSLCLAPPAVTTIHYQAEFDFAGRSDHELSFRQGDVLTVSDTSKEVEQGWLMGTLNGREGLFPENYCIKLEAMPSVQPQKTLRDKSHSPPPPQILLAPVARPRPHARNPSPLSTSSGDDVYAVPDKSVKGRETSPDGLLPTRVMAQLYTHSAPCSPTRQMSPAESDGEKETLESRESSPGDLFKVVALYPWRAQKDDHLSFGKDDVITVYDQNEMWYSGTLGGKVSQMVTDMYVCCYVDLLHRLAGFQSHMSSQFLVGNQYHNRKEEYTYM